MGTQDQERAGIQVTLVSVDLVVIQGFVVCQGIRVSAQPVAILASVD